MDLAPLQFNLRVSSESRQAATATEWWSVRGGRPQDLAAVSRTIGGAGREQQHNCSRLLTSTRAPAGWDYWVTSPWWEYQPSCQKFSAGGTRRFWLIQWMHKIIHHYNNKSYSFCYKAVLVWDSVFCVGFSFSSMLHKWLIYLIPYRSAEMLVEMKYQYINFSNIYLEKYYGMMEMVVMIC